MRWNLLGLLLFLPGCSGSGRVFTTGFEALSDFSAFYSVPQNYQSAATHDLSTAQVRSGTYAHRATVYAAGPVVGGKNTNHRAYPTIQLNKVSGGAYRSPIWVEFWVYVTGGALAQDQWLSFATFTPDATDLWARTILVNLESDGFIRLMHVPYQGQGKRIYQTSTVSFPLNQWVKLSIYLDLSPDQFTPSHSIQGYAKVWQDNVLVSAAKIGGGNGYLSQAHFGLYAPPSVVSGTVYNDDLTIRESTTPVSLE